MPRRAVRLGQSQTASVIVCSTCSEPSTPSTGKTALACKLRLLPQARLRQFGAPINRGEDVEGDAEWCGVGDHRSTNPDPGDQYCSHGGEHYGVHGRLLGSDAERPFSGTAVLSWSYLQPMVSSMAPLALMTRGRSSALATRSSLSRKSASDSGLLISDSPSPTGAQWHELTTPMPNPFRSRKRIPALLPFPGIN